MNFEVQKKLLFHTGIHKSMPCHAERVYCMPWLELPTSYNIVFLVVVVSSVLVYYK